MSDDQLIDFSKYVNRPSGSETEVEFEMADLGVVDLEIDWGDLDDSVELGEVDIGFEVPMASPDSWELDIPDEHDDDDEWFAAVAGSIPTGDEEWPELG